MKLSRITFNPYDQSAQRDLLYPYEMHRTLRRLFPDDGERILWRQDVGPKGPYVLVLSYTPPLTEVLDGRRVRVETKEDTRCFNKGDAFKFCLWAAPLKRPCVKEGQKSRRVAIEDEDGLMAWLTRKAAEGGFQIGRTMIPEARYVYCGQKEHEGGVHHIGFFGVRFEGALRVLDSDRFLKTLQAGIGSGKSMGFGMLSIGSRLAVPKERVIREVSEELATV